MTVASLHLRTSREMSLGYSQLVHGGTFTKCQYILRYLAIDQPNIQDAWQPEHSLVGRTMG